MSIHRLLVANRGEIAVRIIRTCRALGIETVLAASEADLDAVPARLADRTVCIGAPLAYLSVEKIVEAASSVGADALHPGYGFLAENSRLALACAAAGIIFVGPSAEQLDALGDKLEARGHALAAGVPVLPGGEVADHRSATALARELGWPVLVKAAAGGGGRGMKRVDGEPELAQALDIAIAEARGAFGDPRVYLEPLVTSGRHVEVQVLGDGARTIHLGDRDCSIQRRYQKLVEEAPAPALAPPLRDEMRRAAVALGDRLGYRGAGTVEFLVDVERGTFSFLEMNARIQVEHPVTEEVAGVDLVAEQIAVAEGRPLRIAHEDVILTGHAIELRLNAEAWERDFRPSPGTITAAVFPVGEGIRVDTHVQAGSEVPPFYDSLLAKLIVHGSDRTAALERAREALDLCRIEGVATNLGLHRLILRADEFERGGVDTTWLPRFLDEHRIVSTPGGNGNG
jgi:acetyl-CoA carboxylase biotin carboxylase subunit